MRILIIVLLLSFVLGGCPLMTRSDISEKENQRQVQTQVTTVQQQAKVEQENRYLSIQDELRTLSGRLSTLEHKLNQVEQTPQGPSNQDLIEQMKIFEAQIASLKAELEEAKAARVQALAAAPSPVINTELKGANTEKGGGAWDQAESHFNKKDWKNAILSYQSYRDQNPKGKNYAMATYKIGVSFQELKMKDEARAFYEEVMQKFPKTSTAKKAKFRLGQLK